MMKPALKIVSPTSPERQALAQALDDAAPTQGAATRARKAAESAQATLADALAAVPAAESATSEAKARLIDNPAADRSELRKLRQAEVDRRDDLEIAKEVAARTQLLANDAERDHKYAADAVERAVNRVIVTQYDTAIEAAEQAGREFARLAFVAGVIGSAGNPFNGEQNTLVARVEGLNSQFVYRYDPEGLAATRQAAQGPWLAARAALLTDADAPLPVIG